MIPMKQIQDAVLDMGGRLTREEFTALCLAIYEVRRCQPVAPQMKAVWANVRRRMGKSSNAAVSKALERAVLTLFATGDAEVLSGYQRSWLFDRPKPNEFIRVVAQKLWDGQEERG